MCHCNRRLLYRCIGTVYHEPTKSTKRLFTLRLSSYLITAVEQFWLNFQTHLHSHNLTATLLGLLMTPSRHRFTDTRSLAPTNWTSNIDRDAALLPFTLAALTDRHPAASTYEHNFASVYHLSSRVWTNFLFCKDHISWQLCNASDGETMYLTNHMTTICELTQEWDTITILCCRLEHKIHMGNCVKLWAICQNMLLDW